MANLALLHSNLPPDFSFLVNTGWKLEIMKASFNLKNNAYLNKLYRIIYYFQDML